MGRGQIVSGGTNGRYQVKLIYAYRSRVDAKILKAQQNITAIEAQIVTVEAAILAETDPKKKADLVIQKSVLNLQIASLNKEIAYYQTKMPSDPTQAAWCADLTEDLTGNVGTIEIPGEPTTVLVRPGYSGRAVYSASRDGQLMPAIAGEPYQVLFNWMMLPGWQRHKPIYRAGTIAPDSLDYDANTCSVCLDAAYSSQLSLPAIDGGTVTNCEMGDDVQSEYLTEAGEDFCSRNPGHPFCTAGVGAEIHLTDAMLSQLKEANAYVNGAFGRSTDQSGRRVGDRWDIMTTPGVDAGDCEDFALTKMDRLVNYHGWNPDNLKLVTAYAANGEYHAMLGVRTTNRGLVILDNNYPEVMESGRVPYRLDKIALASDSWANYSRRLDNVPIEYMTCGAGAFADGDRVVVEFTGQSWTAPKVIGFLENPEECGFDTVFRFGNNQTGANDWSQLKYSVAMDAWTGNYDIPGTALPGTGHVLRYSCFSTSDNSWIYLFGGYVSLYEHGIGGNSEVLNRSDKMSKTSETWSAIHAMLHRRRDGQGAYINGKSYIWGGTDLNHNWPDRAGYCYFQYFDAGVSYYTSNHEYDGSADAWAARMAVADGRYRDRAFVIGGTGFRLPGGSELYETSPRYGCIWTAVQTFSSTLRGYTPASNSWSIYQSMRNRRGHAACNFLGKGFIGSGATDTEADGDTPGIIGYQDIYDGGWYTSPIWGFATRWIERYDKDTDSWSFWKNDIEHGSYFGSNSACFAGQSGADFGYGYNNDVWKRIDVTAETITEKNGYPATSEYLAMTAEVK